MEEDVWDFYFCRIDDASASIFFNESIRTRAPLPKHDSLVVLSVRMLAPRGDGLPSDGEFATLSKIEKQMEAALAPPKATYVGRTTHAGLRDFYFYTTDAEQLPSAIDEAMRNFSDHEYATPIQSDADWRIYREFLYPSPRDRQCIENRKVCEGLEKHGDTLTATREIAHWAYFASAEAREQFVANAAKVGFSLRERLEPGEIQNQFGVCIARNDRPFWGEINEVTLELFDLAKSLGGDYDGWEAPVVKSDPR